MSNQRFTTRRRPFYWLLALLTLTFAVSVSVQNKTLANSRQPFASSLSGNQQAPSVELTPSVHITETNHLLTPSTGEQNPPHQTGGAETTSWTQLSPATAPSARAEMGFVYDSDRGVMVAIGGSRGFNTRFTETWEFDGTTWQQKFPPQSPPGRDRPAIAYDPIRHVTVLFGGSSPSDDTFYNDTWEYDGVNWIRKSPLNPPSPRNGSTMSYDKDRGSMVMFGGYRIQNGSMTFFDETWEYDGAQWSQRFPLNHPSTRETAGMIYDIGRGRTVLFGGGRAVGTVVFNDTWEWDGNDWHRVTSPVSPPARWAHGMAYDQTRQRTILFGGLTGTTEAYGDTWEFDGTTWTQVSAFPSPSARWDLGMGYNSARNTTVLFGGMYNQGGFQWKNDTWLYKSQSDTPQRPVVLLPGYAGSELRDYRKSNCTPSSGLTIVPTKVFLNLPALGVDFPFDLILSRLQLQQDGYAPLDECADIKVTNILTKVVSMDFYESLYNNLIANGYAVTPCPYDWRLAIDGERDREMMETVEECVKKAQNNNSAQKVDLLAHSTGGLAARQYVLSNPNRAAKIHTIVTLGTPYYGALKSFMMLRYGQTLISILDPFANNSVIKRIALNAPANYYLLPSASFFGAYQGYFFRKVNSRFEQFTDYASMANLLVAEGYNPALVTSAARFHSHYMDDWRGDPLSQIKYFVFTGDGIDTARWVIEETTQKWWQPTPHTTHDVIFSTEGDGTVLLRSANLLDGQRAGNATICTYYKVEHSSLTSDDDVWNDINSALLAGTVDHQRCRLPGQVQTSSWMNDTDSRQLVVDGSGAVHIWDNQGRHAGPLPDSFLLENRIPLVTYMTSGDRTFVSLPPVSTYTITVEAPDSAPLDLKLRTVVPAVTWEEAIEETVVFQDVPTVAGSSATIAYQPLATADSHRVEVDLDSDGVEELRLPPTDVLNQQESADHLSPVSTIQVEGNQDRFGFFTGLIKITINATDVGAGLQRIEYSLDGGKTVNRYSSPFFALAEEVPALAVQAVDRAGNHEYPWNTKRIAKYRLYLPTVFRFTNRPPHMPNTPSPTSGATNLGSSITLGWLGGDPDGNVTTYDLYLDATSGEPTTKVMGNLLSPTYTLQGLAPNTLYAWRVVARDNAGSATTGPIWRFTTAAAVPLEVKISSSSTDSYKLHRKEQGNGLAVDRLVYADRNYRYATVPESVRGATYIATPNDDKAERGLRLVLTVNKPVQLYIAFSDRVTDKPSWFERFQDTGEDLTFSANTGNPVNLSLYRAPFPAGDIRLGENDPLDIGYTMYTIILKD